MNSQRRMVSYIVGHCLHRTMQMAPSEHRLSARLQKLFKVGIEFKSSSKASKLVWQWESLMENQCTFLSNGFFRLETSRLIRKSRNRTSNRMWSDPQKMTDTYEKEHRVEDDIEWYAWVSKEREGISQMFNFEIVRWRQSAKFSIKTFHGSKSLEVRIWNESCLKDIV